DTAGYVVVQAPEHVIENERAKAKAAAKNEALSPEKRAKRKSKAQLRKPPEGAIVWTEETFQRLVDGRPEALMSRMKVDNSMLLNVVARESDAFAVLRDLLRENHEDPRNRARLIRRALRLARSLVRSGVLARLEEPDEFGRRFVLTEALPDNFALNQPLAHFALAALDVLDPEDPEHTLNLVSVVEAVLEGPRQILFAQQNAARGEAVAEMKADGIEYEERMTLLDEVTWPQPLAELLEGVYEIYRQTHPWLPEDGLSPKSIVREMYEQAMSFTDFVSRYELARSEGLVLRYLTDAYRTLQHTVPERHATPELEDLVEWLGETVRQTDSSLLDEWESLTDPDAVARAAAGEPPPPPRPLSQQERPFHVMIRNAMFSRVLLAARDDLDALMRLERAGADLFDPPREVLMTRSVWDDALEAYYAEHDSIATTGDARGPAMLRIDRTGRSWPVRQVISDPEGHHDWVIEATVDLDASDDLGQAVVQVTSFRRLDGF
ncbi:MAG: DUF3516 domain-containing protein, partial [Nocardioides sp.]|nr:DUF3516 domain-containing protein [Nocardioides sp.]